MKAWLQSAWILGFVLLLSRPTKAFQAPSSRHSTRRQSATTGSSTTNIATNDAYNPGLDKATVTIIEPLSNVDVILLGCFHGSQTSARDVQALLTHTDHITKAVVLELCASRFSSLRKGMAQADASSGVISSEDASVESMELATQQHQQPWLAGFVQMVSKLSESRGISTGIASVVLGLASGWQSAMAGLDPGLEFRTALIHNPEGSDIVLADQNVDETLHKLGKLPVILLGLWSELLAKGWDFSFGMEADALGTAIFGSLDHAGSQLTVADFMTRSPASIKDLLRLVLTPLFALEAVWLLLSSSSNYGTTIFTPPLAEMDVAMVESDLSTTIASTALNLGLLFACYMGIALPAARVILRERDERLARGIQAACRVVAQRTCQGEGQGRVVAVLGLLHVNGVARQLLASGEEDHLPP